MDYSSENFDGFTFLQACQASNSFEVRKYKSKRTELSVIVADVPGPLVHGAFFVATEAKDDDGLPHTLEHLIFLGSADYPFKGSLDLIANRCLASGTNAWTEIDHTAYTVSTVGAEGFLNLLPIYLDHLFFATLTDSGFTTEVYHVTEEAKDSGVVFCEMQGLECSSEILTVNEFLRVLYPTGCGYRYETGGIVTNLRHSTSIDKVRKFHKQFYCPKNTTIVVAGLVSDAKLLKAIHEFEEKLINRCTDPFDKAWQSPVPVLQKPSIRAITYPSDHEDNGTVIIGWQGPSVIDEYYQIVAVKILLTYLTDTAASPLMKFFVETNDPFCSDISVDIIENSISAVYLMFENVVLNKMPFLHETLIRLLAQIANDDSGNFKFNHYRMEAVIQRFAMKQLLALEKEPRKIAYLLIGDILYGKSSDDVRLVISPYNSSFRKPNFVHYDFQMFYRLNQQEIAKRLLQEPVSFWISLLKKYFIERPSGTVLGYPSKTEHAIRAFFENERIENRKKELGTDGLSSKGKILQEAIAENNVLPPDELIASVPSPSVENLNFFPLKRYTSTTEVQHPDFNLQSTLVYTELDDVSSKFIYAYVMMDSSKLSSEQRLYLPLFLEYILECPVRRADELISAETIAAELERDMVSVESCLGLKCDNRFSCGQYSFVTTLSMEMIPENFGKGMNWIRELLYQSVFNKERVRMIAQKLLNSIAQIRREPNIIIKHLSRMMWFNMDTNYHSCTVLSQTQFLSQIIEKLNAEDTGEEIIRHLESVRSQLTVPENIILHLSVNVAELATIFPNPAICLSKIISKTSHPCFSRVQISPDFEFRSSLTGVQSCVVGMSSADSSFLHHSTNSINDFHHPDLPALLVFIEYVTQLEGPMWRDIRGFGLAYHYNVIVEPDKNVLTLLLFRSTDIIQAFRRTKNIFDECINTVAKWNALHFESAKNSLIFSIVEREKNISSLCLQSVLSYFQGTSEDYNRNLIKKVNQVRLEEMENVGKTYLEPLFNPKTSLTTIICHNTKCKEVAENFSEMGYDLTEFSNLEDSYLNPAVMKRLLHEG